MAKRKREATRAEPIKKIPRSLCLKPSPIPAGLNKSNVLSALLEELRATNLPKCRRGNVGGGDKAKAMAMGKVHIYIGNKVLDAQYNTKFPKLFDLLKWLIALHHPKFKYSTIQVNYGFACDKHVDKNNVGPSFSISLGDFTGGELVVESGGRETAYNTRNKFVKFDGRNPHWVKPFKGERYSLVYFCHTFNLK